MSNFTQGPWEVDNEDLYILAKDERGTFPVAEMRGLGHMSIKYGQDKAVQILNANARLVAAAPELYEAVFGLFNYAYEVLHYAGGEEETRGRAPRILKEIREYEALLRRIEGEE